MHMDVGLGWVGGVQQRRWRLVLISHAIAAKGRWVACPKRASLPSFETTTTNQGSLWEIFMIG